MGRKQGPVRRAERAERQNDPSNWKNWSQSKLREVYGDDKFQENLEASANRRNLSAGNFLKGFAGALISPITTPVGILTNNPSLIGFGYGNPKDPNKVFPQPHIIDDQTGEVIANPAMDNVESYLASHSAKQNAYDNSTISGLVRDGGINIDDPYMGIAPKISDKTIDTYEKFIERTQNSPAMRAGVFDPKDLYQNYVMDQDFQAARDNRDIGLDEFARQYPGSQTAKRRRIDNRIPSSLDMEF